MWTLGEYTQGLHLPGAELWCVRWSLETSCREYWYACIFLPLRMMYACIVEGSLIIRCHSATGGFSRHMSGVVIDGG
jgi:hypothetical protein